MRIIYLDYMQFKYIKTFYLGPRIWKQKFKFAPAIIKKIKINRVNKNIDICVIILDDLRAAFDFKFEINNL